MKLSHGLYSSRSRGKLEEQEHLVKLAPNGWKEKKELEAAYEEINVENTESPAGTKKQHLNKNYDRASTNVEERSTWARLIKIHL